MAITHKYVRDTNGSDSNSGDSHAAAYKTIQKAVDVIGGSAGNQINLNDESKFTLSTTVVWTSFSPSNSADNPLMFRGYTSVLDDGGTYEIDGNNAVATLFSATSHPQHVSWVDGKMHNTTDAVVDTPNYCSVMRCEVYNGGSGETIDLSISGVVVNCHIHTETSGAKPIRGTSYSKYLYNFIDGHDDLLQLASHNQAIGNIIINHGGDGMTANDSTLIAENTLIADGTAGKHGITHSSANEKGVILNNIIKDFAGDAIEGAAGANHLLIGHNTMHGNGTDDITTKEVFGLDLTSNDLTTDPELTNLTTDLALKRSSPSIRKGYPTSYKGLSSTVTEPDIGAVSAMAGVLQQNTSGP